MPTAYKVIKTTGTKRDIRDRKTDAQVGTLSGSGNHWELSLFGKSFKLKSKAKALGVVRGVYAGREMVAR